MKTVGRRRFLAGLAGIVAGGAVLPALAKQNEALAKQNDFVGVRTGRTTHYGDDGVKWPYGYKSYKYYVTFGTGSYYNVGETVQINDHPHVEPANYLITDRWGLALRGSRAWYEYDAVRVW